jgi:hypothetical protein
VALERTAVETIGLTGCMHWPREVPRAVYNVTCWLLLWKALHSARHKRAGVCGKELWTSRQLTPVAYQPPIAFDRCLSLQSTDRQTDRPKYICPNLLRSLAMTFELLFYFFVQFDLVWRLANTVLTYFISEAPCILLTRNLQRIIIALNTQWRTVCQIFSNETPTPREIAFIEYFNVTSIQCHSIQRNLIEMPSELRKMMDCKCNSHLIIV